MIRVTVTCEECRKEGELNIHLYEGTALGGMTGQIVVGILHPRDGDGWHRRGKKGGDIDDAADLCSEECGAAWSKKQMAQAEYEALIRTAKRTPTI